MDSLPEPIVRILDAGLGGVLGGGLLALFVAITAAIISKIRRNRKPLDLEDIVDTPEEFPSPPSSDTKYINSKTTQDRKKGLFLVVVLVVIVMGLFPPWHVEMVRGNINIGFSFIWDPPHKAASIDINRLLLQWVIVSVCAFGAYTLIK